jgi:FKBP-type peptidyl-prolyl cis-trans isomerase
MLRSLSTRRMLPVVALVSVALTLTGCGSDGKKKASDTKSSATKDSGCGYKSGSTSDAVKIEGDFGKTVTATFDKPLKADSLQRSVVTQGTGAKPATGEVLNVQLTVYNGTSGKLIDQAPTKFTVGDTTLPKDLLASYECVNLGSRIATTFPAKDLYGDTGNAQAGIAAGDSLVLVSDVIGEYVGPKPKAWPSAPSVTFNGRKSPKVTLPKGKASPDLLLHVIKKGTGAVVTQGASVTVNYKGIIWGTGKVFDESYGKGKAPATFTTTGVVEGFGAALVGQKVGTRLIVSIPPQYGYGTSGNPQGGIKGTDTLVFVIEIQSTKAAQ